MYSCAEQDLCAIWLYRKTSKWGEKEEMGLGGIGRITCYILIISIPTPFLF
jgi:hypothetical protein